jgi:hypothetical protein
VHRPDDGPGAVRGDAGVGSGPWTKAGEDRVGVGDRGLERGRVRGGQVGGDHADRAGQVCRVAHDGGHVVAGVEGLLQELPADAAGRR